MSMTLANAKIYVARIIAGGNVQNSLDMAGESILHTYQKWQAKKFWRFLLKDTENSTAVASVITTTSTTIPAPSTGAFDFVNVGQTLSGTYIASGSTVSSINYNTDGTTASIVVSLAPSAGTATVTFTADIPMIAGTRSYNLPLDFGAPFSLRMLTNPRDLVWKDHRSWDRMIVDQTVLSTPAEYTTFNPFSELTQNFGETRLMLDVPPALSDTLRLKYYRRFNTSATSIDIPDDYLYLFLDMARAHLLVTKKAQDNPAQFIQGAKEDTEDAAENDEQATDDDDADQCLKPGYEAGGSRAPWGNGAFDPYRY